MYFENIPNIKHNFNWEDIAGYSGGFIPSVDMQDIFRRITFTDKTRNDPGSFETYFVTEGQRPEEVAGDFYGNPNLWWVVLLCNNIIDPIGEWPTSHGQIVSTFNNYLSGDSYFLFENPDIRRGDIIIRRDVNLEHDSASIDIDNFGEIDSYDKLLHRIDVKKSKGTISENDEVYIFRKNIIAGEERWDSVGGFGLSVCEGCTGCYQQYFGATFCADVVGPTAHAPACATAGSTFAIVQRKETIANAVHHFNYLSDTVNPYSAFPATEHVGPSGDFYSTQSVCGMTGTILYRYMTKELSDEVTTFTNLKETVRKNDERRKLKLISPSIIPALIIEFKSIMRGSIPRGTTKIIE
mgnify:CR=1 FL=1